MTHTFIKKTYVGMYILPENHHLLFEFSEYNNKWFINLNVFKII